MQRSGSGHCQVWPIEASSSFLWCLGWYSWPQCCPRWYERCSRRSDCSDRSAWGYCATSSGSTWPYCLTLVVDWCQAGISWENGSWYLGLELGFQVELGPSCFYLESHSWYSFAAWSSWSSVNFAFGSHEIVDNRQLRLHLAWVRQYYFPASDLTSIFWCWLLDFAWNHFWLHQVAKFSSTHWSDFCRCACYQLFELAYLLKALNSLSCSLSLAPSWMASPGTTDRSQLRSWNCLSSQSSRPVCFQKSFGCDLSPCPYFQWMRYYWCLAAWSQTVSESSDFHHSHFSVAHHSLSFWLLLQLHNDAWYFESIEEQRHSWAHFLAWVIVLASLACREIGHHDGFLVKSFEEERRRSASVVAARHSRLLISLLAVLEMPGSRATISCLDFIAYSYQGKPFDCSWMIIDWAT